MDGITHSCMCPPIAGVFKTAMQPYLDYVRHSGKYSSQLIETTLEYQDHVPDGLEVSTFLN